MIGKVGQLSEGTQNQINQIYDRQKEVLVGKRNVNCLSCAKEPGQKHGSGSDGRLYHGMQNKNKDGSPKKGGIDDDSDKTAAKKLLNMKWDNIGLNQTNYTTLPAGGY